MNHKDYGMAIVTLVLCLATPTSSKEVWYLSAKVVDVARWLVTSEYLSAKERQKPQTDSAGGDGTLPERDFSNFLDCRTKFVAMLESPFDSAHFLEYAVDVKQTGEHDRIVCVVSRDSVWVFSTPLVVMGLGKYATKLEYLLQLERLNTLGSERALSFVLFTLEIAGISSDDSPHMIRNWKDIFYSVGASPPDSIDATEDPIYKVIAPPKVEDIPDGFHITVYWWSNDRNVHRTIFAISLGRFEVLKDEILGQRGKAGSKA